MGLISRWKLVWGPAIGLVVGPVIACLGIPAIFVFDTTLCLTGALLGLAVAYLYESLTRRHSHHELLADLSAIACAVTSGIAAVVRVVTPKRRWFRFSLATFFGLVTIFGLCAGWIGNNLYRVSKRDELTERFLGMEPPRYLGRCFRVVVGPPLWAHIFVSSKVSASPTINGFHCLRLPATNSVSGRLPRDNSSCLSPTVPDAMSGAGARTGNQETKRPSSFVDAATMARALRRTSVASCIACCSRSSRGHGCWKLPTTK